MTQYDFALWVDFSPIGCGPDVSLLLAGIAKALVDDGKGV